MLIGYVHMFIRCCEYACVDLSSHVRLLPFMLVFERTMCLYKFSIDVHMSLLDVSHVYEMSLHMHQFSLLCRVNLFSYVISFCCFHFMRPYPYAPIHFMSHVRLFLYTPFGCHS
jgi:hypothetical protein